jgi:hypothetical protein
MTLPGSQETVFWICWLYGGPVSTQLYEMQCCWLVDVVSFGVAKDDEFS